MHVTPILDTSRMLPYSLSKNSCMHHTSLMPKRTAVPCATMLCHLELVGPAMTLVRILPCKRLKCVTLSLTTDTDGVCAETQVERPRRELVKDVHTSGRINTLALQCADALWGPQTVGLRSASIWQIAPTRR